MVSTFKSLFEFGKTAHDEYQAQHQGTGNIEEKQRQIQRARLDKLHELLTHVMTRTTNAPALPLILVLDDAQWLDHASTRFIENLFHHAIQNDWPLLILATHWEQEWNLALDQENSAHPLPGLCQRMRAIDQNCLSLHDIDRLAGMEIIIKAALPGLTDEQVGFLSQRADGNPLLLNEILQELQNERWYFQDQDLTQPLIPSALDKMAQKSFKLHDVQARRYHQMSEQLKTLLSYASYQGMRFIKDFLLKTATKLDSTLTTPETEETLSSAIRPHAILAASSAAIYEFRHRVFYDLARQRIELLPEIQTCLADQIITAGRQWLQQGNAEELSEDEQESFYLLLLAQTVPLQSDPALHLKLLATLLQRYQQQGYFSRAIKHLEALEAHLPKNPHINFDTLSFWTQLDLIDLLKEVNRIETAEKLAHAVQQQCTALLSRHGDSEQRLRDVFISYFKLAFCSSENKPKQCALLCEALRYNEKRILSYPQYAEQTIAEHEQLLQIAEPFLQALNDETVNHQFNSFQQNLARFKQNRGI